MRTKDVLEFWGKARPESEAGVAWHPVAYHLLDVAAVADALLKARPQTAQRAGWLLGLQPEEARQVLVSLIAIHDLGKFAPRFQQLATPLGWSWPSALTGLDASRLEPTVHTADGLLLWRKVLRAEFTQRIWVNGESAIDALECAIYGHHGRPVELPSGPLASRFNEGSVEAARLCARLVLDCVLSSPVTSQPIDRKRLRTASWWVAGFTTIADWIGSRATWFPYTASIEGDDNLSLYWVQARRLAEKAVRAAGLSAIDSAPLQSFDSLTSQRSPTPTQEWAATVPLPEGPMLAIIEDATGSGKTEAAQMLVHRLMASGRASGAYWAMPTQATANAMYDRQRDAISALFAPNAGRWPSLTLGHGQAKLHDGYRDTVIRDPGESVDPEWADSRNGDDASAVACAAFLADDRRAALLADIGAGTVDQTLLGVLPSRFNAVRLFALAEKVLVLDEVHAFDAYMATEVAHLLRFHASLGGSAVLLSATLPEPRRRELERAWNRGGRDDLSASEDDANDERGELTSPYPLATLATVGDEAVLRFTPDAAAWTVRSVQTRIVSTFDEALEYVVGAASQGAAVVWIRNTVDECLRAAATIETRGGAPLVFHARFAQGDRQRIEADVMRRFGRESTPEARLGSILIATQVVEQSLDLDFDAMVSDLAPIDLLIQRAGRLRRHSRSAAERPEGIPHELLVLSPDGVREVTRDWLNDILPNTRYVYPNLGVLWRTLRALREAGTLDAPANLRALIRCVYECEDVPDVLQAAANAATGSEFADQAIADYTVLDLGKGYCAGRAWTDDLRAKTRLGEEQVAVRIARGQDGRLAPWFGDEGLVEWKRWLLSEVKLSAKRVCWDATPSGPWRDQIETLRAGWHRFEQKIPVLVLESDSDGWTGSLQSASGRKEVRIHYSAVRGIQYA